MQAINDLTSTFNKRMEDFEAQLTKSTSPVQTDVAGLSTEFAAFRAFVTQALQLLQQQVEALSQTVDTIEMTGRRKMLLLHGVTEVNEENVTTTAVKMITQHFNHQDLTAANFKRCQRLGRATSNRKPRPILLKFSDVTLRDSLWFNKTKLKGTGITLSEFLTKPRHDLFMAARERLGIARCWTREGFVYILGPDGVRRRVVSVSELNEIDNSPPKPPIVIPKVTAAKSKRAAATKK